MPKYNKPPYVNNIWADGAVEGNSVFPSESKYETGWIQEKPPYENENAINNKHDSYIAYINQAGIPEWDSETEYQNGKSYVQASNGRIYKCIQTNNNRNPATSGNSTYWELFEGNRQATTSTRGTVKLSTNNQTIAGSESSVAVTPSSLTNSIGSDKLRNNSVTPSKLGTSSDITNWAWGRLDSYMDRSGQNSLGRSGYQKLPGGLIMQWGRDTSSGSGNVVVNFPIQFPNACVSLAITPVFGDPDNSYASTGNISPSRSSFNLRIRGANTGELTNVTCMWLAIGY